MESGELIVRSSRYRETRSLGLTPAFATRILTGVPLLVLGPVNAPGQATLPGPTQGPGAATEEVPV